MKSKILIIDIDVQTINSLTSFLTAINLQPIVVHKWPTHIKSLREEELAAIFVDVDLPSVHLDKLFEQFENGLNNNDFQMFFLYTRTYSPRFQKAGALSHSASFKKPVMLEDIYQAMQKFLPIDGLPAQKSDFHATLFEYKNFSSEFKEWLQMFGSVMNNRKRNEETTG